VTAQYLADMLGKSDEDLAATLWENSNRFFGLPV
jgi:TatD DNase family protein